MLRQFRIALVALTLFTVITGLVYPLVITGLAQAIFPDEANGSLIERGGTVLGSGIVGQSFTSPGYFWGRLSATGPVPYNAAASSGSNFGPLHPALLEAVQKRIQDLRNLDPGNTQTIPVDLVTSSGSGLDPHISIAAAMYQIPRVARERNLDEEKVRALVYRVGEGRQLGVLGEPRVNVLKLNLELDGLYHSREANP
jgi:K+-transporting ATPase ATPase C chain